jgi:hypothetical protein
MQREKAMQLASAVTQTYGELVPYRQQIAVALMSLLPDDVSAFAASPSSKAPGVWAISERSLYQVLVDNYEREPGQNPPAQITCARRPLDPGGSTVSVRERLEQRGQATVRQRRWEFILAAGEEDRRALSPWGAAPPAPWHQPRTRKRPACRQIRPLMPTPRIGTK